MKTENISISGNDKLSLISNMSTMLSAGIPILETIDSLLEDSKGNVKKILETVREDLTQGKQVYIAFSKFPNVFDKVTVNIVKASEEAGTLDTTLKDIKENIQRDMEFVDKIRSAMIYPVVIIGLFLVVLIGILTFVIPRISRVFLSLRVELPLPTKIMIFVSNIMVNYTLFFVSVTIILIVGLFFLYKTKKKLIFDFFSSLPFISDLVRQIDLTRFCRSLYLLLSSGIPITIAMELAQDVVVKKDVQKAIHHSMELILSGKKLSEGFKEKKKIIPPIMIKITEAGEKTGTLEKSMQDISEYMDYQVSKTLKTVTALIEPIMLIFVGVMIGGMMLSIIAPIYGLISQVGTR